MLSYFLSGLRLNNRCPDFLIIGVQKSGTTTLYDMLAMVPGFSPSSNKELGFFNKDVLYGRGMQWYSRQFINSNGLRFEATPAYIYHPQVAERIYKYNPKCKFVVVLREPASRCFSAYAMFKRFNRDPNIAKHIFENFTKNANDNNKKALSKLLFDENFPSFRKVVEDDLERIKQCSVELEPSFVRRGLYAKQIRHFLNYFDLKQFLFIEQSELSEVRSLCGKIANFLGIKIDLDDLPNPVVSNEGGYQVIRENDQVVISELKSFYAPFNEDLFNLIGRRYKWN